MQNTNITQNERSEQVIPRCYHYSPKEGRFVSAKQQKRYEQQKIKQSKTRKIVNGICIAISIVILTLVIFHSAFLVYGIATLFQSWGGV